MHLPGWFAGILGAIQPGKLLVGLNKRLSKVHKNEAHAWGSLEEINGNFLAFSKRDLSVTIFSKSLGFQIY